MGPETMSLIMYLLTDEQLHDLKVGIEDGCEQRYEWERDSSLPDILIKAEFMAVRDAVVLEEARRNEQLRRAMAPSSITVDGVVYERRSSDG